MSHFAHDQAIKIKEYFDDHQKQLSYKVFIRNGVVDLSNEEESDQEVWKPKPVKQKEKTSVEEETTEKKAEKKSSSDVDVSSSVP